MANDERTVIAKLARSSKTGLISVPSAARTLGTSRAVAHLRLGRLARRGWVHRARRGLYLVLPLETEPGQKSAVEDPWVLAREVFGPCYIGGWSAAEHWGLTEQLFRSTLVVTAAPVRTTNVEILGHPFRIFRIPRSRLAAGVVMEWRGAERVGVSGLERTLVDCVRNPELCGGSRHLVQVAKAYGEHPKHDFGRLVTIGRQSASGAAWKRLGYLAELLWPQERRLLDAARRHMTTGYARLDPTVRRRGKLLTRWRLWVNVDIDELRSDESTS
jgi:predicted transcriptional regulator of viral defense system